MKRFLYFFVIIATCSLFSCGDMIDIYPVENNTADNFYSSEYEIQQAVVGIYAYLGGNGGNDYPTDMYWQTSESRSDNLYYATLANAQRDQVDMRNFQVTDVTSLNRDIYARLYQIVNAANTLLEKAPKEYTRFHAEARFLRALAYFDLVRAYGEQPVLDHVVSSEEAKGMQRQSIEDVYKQIIADLEFAGDNLDPFYYGDEAGRVGAVAAKCLMGEVYVTMAGYPLKDPTGYTKAENTLAGIMDDVKVRFANNFGDIFDVNQENTWDIFSVQFASGNQKLGSSLPRYITFGSASTSPFPEWVYTGYNQLGQDFRVDDRLVNAMKADGDKRFDVTVMDGFWTTIAHGATPEEDPVNWDARRVVKKFLPQDPITHTPTDNTNNTIKSANDFPINFPILRPADAYLLYAEALINNGKTGEAEKWINAIRKRAGLPILSNPSINDIMDERRREFLGEGKRFFDLVRMGEDTFLATLKEFSDHYNHVTLMGASEPSKKDMLLPIPLTVMNIHTSWDNNPGY